MTALAFAVVAASVPVALLVGLATRRMSAALAVVLDLWVAAGLLHLSATASWTAIVSAAALIAIRKLVVLALSRRP